MSTATTNPVTPAAPTARLGHRLVGNSLWNVAAYFVLVGLTFVSLPFFIAHLGKTHYGVLVLLSSLTAPLGLLNFGFGQATVKYVSESIARSDMAQASRQVANTLLFNLGIGVFGATAMFLLARVLAARVFKLSAEDLPMVESCLHWTALSWVITQLAGTFTAVPTALQQFRMVSLGTMLYSSTSIVVSVVPLLLGHGLLAVVKVRAVWSLLGLIGWALAARNALPAISFRPSYHADSFRRSFGFGLWQTAGSVGSLLANQADKFLLGIYLSAEAVGLFNIPFVVYTTTFNVVNKLSESAFPAVSELHGRGETRRGVEILLKAGGLLGLLVVCLQGALYVFAADLLRLYVGPSVSVATAHVLRVFALTAIIAAPSVMVNQYLLGMGMTSWLGLSAVASGATSLLVGWVLIPRFGLAGAAWSDLLAVGLSRPLVHLLLWRRCLRPHVGGFRFFSAFYGAASVSLPLVLLLDAGRRVGHLHLGWPGLLSGLALTGLGLGAAVILADRLLFGKQLQLDELQRTIRNKLTK